MRKSAQRMNNLIELKENEEFEIDIIEEFTTPNKEKPDDPYICYEGILKGEKVQFFGSGGLNYQIRNGIKEIGLPLKIWVTYKGKKEVSTDISRQGFVHDYKVDYDTDNPEIKEIPF